MHFEEIKAKLRIAGYTQALLAKNNNVTRGAVSQVVKGAAKSQSIAWQISDICQVEVGILWPGKYQKLEYQQALLRVDPIGHAKLMADVGEMLVSGRQLAGQVRQPCV